MYSNYHPRFSRRPIMHRPLSGERGKGDETYWNESLLSQMFSFKHPAESRLINVLTEDLLYLSHNIKGSSRGLSLRLAARDDVREGLVVIEGRWLAIN